MSNTKFILHASELAACVGLNRFKPREQMIEVYKVRYRCIDMPTIHQSINKKATEATSKLSKAFNHSHEPVVTDVLHIMDADEEKSARTCDNYVLSLGNNNPRVQELSNKVKSISRSLSECVKQGILSEEQKQALHQEVSSRLSRACGRVGEPEVVQHINNKQNWCPESFVATDSLIELKINQTHCALYRKQLLCKIPHPQSDTESPVYVDVYIGGKADGLYEVNKTYGIVEIKNRVSRLFNKVYDYERVQILAYMHIYGLKEVPGKLIERYGDVNNVKIHDINFDRHFWNYEIIPRVIQFVSDVFLS